MEQGCWRARCFLRGKDLLWGTTLHLQRVDLDLDLEGQRWGEKLNHSATSKKSRCLPRAQRLLKYWLVLCCFWLEWEKRILSPRIFDTKIDFKNVWGGDGADPGITVPAMTKKRGEWGLLCQRNLTSNLKSTFSVLKFPQDSLNFCWVRMFLAAGSKKP